MLSLASPWLMLGLLGLALPIAAHLIYAHQSERVLFPSIHLITPTRTPQSRRKSVSNLLLLFIRILTILFLTLGAAGLQWVEPESEITASETIILIDQSASMNTSDKQSLVADLLEALVRKQEGKTGFITFGKQPNVLLPLTRDSKEILAAIENVKAGLEEGRPQSAIDTAVQLFGSQSAEKHLHIISDYQAVNWQSINHQLGEASISFTLHEINDEHRNNQTILTAAHSELSQKSQRISASLTSVADETQQRLLQLQVGDSVFEKTVAIHPDRPNQVFFEIPQTFSGAATLRFVEQDDYEADDTYHFWITRPLPSKVAFVTPGSDAEISREEPKFLASALLSQAENQWRRFEMVDSLAGKGRKLHPDFVDILMIAGFPKNLSPAIANGLRQYMQEGGIVLATTGNGMAETLKQLEDMKILSARFLGAGSKTRLDMKPFRISPLRKESLLADIFPGAASRDLMLTRIYRYARLETDDDISVVARVDGEYPLIIDKAMGKGRFLFLTLRLDQRWTDLPLRPSFVPLVKELLLPYLNIAQPPALSVGDSLNNGSEIFSATKPGHAVFKGERVSINVSRHESRPEILSTRLVAQALGGNEQTGTSTYTASASRSQETSGNFEDNTRSFTPWLLLIALCLLLLESFINIAGSKRHSLPGHLSESRP